MSGLLEEFEKTKTFKYFYSSLLKFDESLNCYVAKEKWRNKEAELLTAAWWMFQEQQTQIGYEQLQAECWRSEYLKMVALRDVLQKRNDDALECVYQAKDGHYGFTSEGGDVDCFAKHLDKALRGNPNE